jgi:UDP-N-acetylmuramoyl-tripeptide--D-alanyl-D-alanine ligase
MKLSQDMERVTYGKSGIYKGSCLDDNLLLKLHLLDYDIDIQTQLTGSYNFPNVMAAVSVGLHFSVPMENIKSALTAYIPDNSRSQIIKKEGYTIILDAYNANPSSMKLAIENIAKMNVENKVLLLGQMAELGESSTAEHQAIVDLIRRYSFDYVYLLGTEFAKTNADTFWLYPDYEQLKTALAEQLPNTATVLIKGSRSMKMEQFLDAIFV